MSKTLNDEVGDDDASESSSVYTDASESYPSLESGHEGDIDEESIHEIMESVNNFRQRHQHSNTKKLENDANGTISSLARSASRRSQRERMRSSDSNSGSFSNSTMSAGTSMSSFSQKGDLVLPQGFILNADNVDFGQDKSIRSPLTPKNTVYYEEIFVDPVKDVDIGPTLRFFCGWSPCCCCLFNKNASSDENSEKENDDTETGQDETYYSNEYSTVKSARSTLVPMLRSQIPATNPYPVNKNALGLLILNLFYHLGSSLWTGTVFSIYLYQILPGDSNTSIGIVEGIKIASRLLVTAFCNATFDSKEDPESSFFTRPTFLKIGGVITLAATVAQITLLSYISQIYHRYPDDDSLEHVHVLSGDHFLVLQAFCILAVLWGIQSGVVLNQNGPAPSLFKDSIYAEVKNDYIFFYHILSILSNTVGALISLLLFIFLRAKDWNIKDLTVIMYVGMGFQLLAGCSMFLQKLKWKNDQALQRPSPPPTPPPPQTMTITTGRTSNHNANSQLSSATTLWERRRWIPYLLFSHHFLFNTGSGMIVPFFPLFFKINCDFGPTSILGIFTILPLLNEVFSQFLYSLYSRFRFAHFETYLLSKSEGVIFLFLIVFSQLLDDFKEQGTFWIACMFLLRTICVNSGSYVEDNFFYEASVASVAQIGLINEGMMKGLKKRWSARLEIGKICSYAFGAVIGGMSVDAFDGEYGRMFLIAACLQTIGIAVLLSLYQLIPKQSRIYENSSVEESEDDVFTDHDDSLEQLLL